MTIVLPDDLFPVLLQIREILRKESPLRQQMILEVLGAYHAHGMGSTQDALIVIGSIAKHSRQLLDQISPSLN